MSGKVRESQGKSGKVRKFHPFWRPDTLHRINHVLAGFIHTRERNPAQDSMNIVKFSWMPCLGIVKNDTQ